jgi:hypothetical protein
MPVIRGRASGLSGICAAATRVKATKEAAAISFEFMRNLEKTAAASP